MKDKQEETGHLRSTRLEKLRVLRAAHQVYDNHTERWFERKNNSGELIRKSVAGIVELNREFRDWGRTPEAQQEKIDIRICGRLMARRSNFFVLQDGAGGDCRIQLYLDKAGQNFSSEQVSAIKAWDIGDLLAVQGRLQRSGRGQGDLYIIIANCSEYPARILAKALRPLPEKYHGLKDREIRYRQRYLDLLMREESRAVFCKRAALLQDLREFFVRRDFLEVETPMLHYVPGGAAARPFSTYHNALHQELFLRIAPELYLKRLLIGGFDRVFEINRSFRNEGLSTEHNPEFTMLEFYQAYSRFEELMELIEELLCGLVSDRETDTQELSWRGQRCNFSRPFARCSLAEAILKKHSALERCEHATAEWQLPGRKRLAAYAHEIGIDVQPLWGAGKIALEIFEKTVEADLRDPVFITHYPAEVSPLARCVDNRSLREENDLEASPVLTERFELFVAGVEIANGFSELNDPEEQHYRFMRQAQAQDDSDESVVFDQDYIVALEYGMPPAAGAGIGIDRLLMLLTGSDSIRDVLLFPQLRPKQASDVDFIDR